MGDVCFQYVVFLRLELKIQHVKCKILLLVLIITDLKSCGFVIQVHVTSEPFGKQYSKDHWLETFYRSVKKSIFKKIISCSPICFAKFSRNLTGQSGAKLGNFM